MRPFITMTKDTELVYSTDSSLNKYCNKCKKILSECRCAQSDLPVNIDTIRAVLRIEKSNRNGKDVTVIDKLPSNEQFLKDLAQKLKKQCGSGGTYKISATSGCIEIQGDKRELLRKELEKQGIKCR